MKIDEKAFKVAMEEFEYTQLDVDYKDSRRDFIEAYEEAKTEYTHEESIE